MAERGKPLAFAVRVTIRAMLRDGVSVSETARRLRLSRRTVQKWGRVKLRFSGG